MINMCIWAGCAVLAGLWSPHNAVAVDPETILVNGGGYEMTSLDLATRLAGTWMITEVRNATIPAYSAPTLVFEPERLAGFAGCNNFGVPVTYGDDNGLVLGDPEFTLNICGAGEMDLEAQIFNALQRISEVAFDSENQITLSAFGTTMLKAEKAQ
jgi:heat shock protein HslJ